MRQVVDDLTERQTILQQLHNKSGHKVLCISPGKLVCYFLVRAKAKVI